MKLENKKGFKDEIKKVAEIIRRSSPALVLTGAGLSVESGIPPFRGPGGLWEKYNFEEYGHIRVLQSNPQKAWIMLRDMLETILNAKPNEAHYALAELQKAGFISYIITQNVDGLHEAAGSIRVVNFHGGGRKLYCMKCGRERVVHNVKDIDPIRCECGGYFRPDFIFYGEPIPQKELLTAFSEAQRANVVLVIGTTAQVYPAAQIPYEVKRRGGSVVEINPYSTSLTTTITDVFIEESASKTLREIKKILLE